MRYVPQAHEDEGILRGYGNPPQYEVLVDCLQTDDLPIGLGKQEMTFEGFPGIEPGTIFNVQGVRRHYKFRDPKEDRSRTERTLAWTKPAPPFIDATIYVKSSGA